MTTAVQKRPTKRPTAKPAERNTRAKTNTGTTGKAKRYTVSDGELLLNLEVEGKWFVVTSPLDPELVTQARTIEEAFRMAYDAKKLLEKYRAGLLKESKSRRKRAKSLSE